ncbi:hypothetical protein CCAX7_22020 [Capsulimonas corticalis]|uniref:Uncharacterized protein n=1 Tax=Capsulimonas corticalis TaxID=2219043 RepID=A0A402D241_9BACT|nr:protease pro-enzyme activation domain-containing protein [Capsulimonas corticalis]BDI30151.1 hypothetical protein CCAX7_22020 [Capsulimonas corticalis]
MYSRYQRRSRVRRSGAAYGAALTAILAVAGAHAAGAQTAVSLEAIKAKFAAQPRVQIQHNSIAPGVASLLRQSRFLGRQDGQTPVSIAISLPLRNRAALDEYVRRIADPKDALYGHGLTTKQFADLYAPAQEDFDTVLQYAKASGLSVVEASPTRSLVVLSGESRNVESAFGVKLSRYLLPSGYVVHANDVAPTVPQSISSRIIGVTGLNSIPATSYHKHIVPKYVSDIQSFLSGNVAGTGPAGGLAPSDIVTAYNLTSLTYKGEGQTVALYELDGYDPKDITTYTTRFGLGASNLTNVLVNGFSGVPGADGGTGYVEVVLDIDMVLALAPKLQNLYVYEAKNNGTDSLALYKRIADDNVAKVVSTSWGLPETIIDDATRLSEDQIFTQMSAQRQSIFDASGDSGAYDDAPIAAQLGVAATVCVDDPASQPHVTGVGGTTLTTVSPGGAYTSETVWKGTLAGAADNDGGSGGGKSVKWPKPDFQKSPTAVGEDAVNRDVPDVALDADGATGYDIYVGAFASSTSTGWFTVGGTSAAAPLWGAFFSLVNQQRSGNGLSFIGEANPPIYAVARDATNYAAAFHDVTTGDNLVYKAKVGYDDATGWGSFNGAPLLNLLAPVNTATLGTLSGTVTNSNLTPIAGATVHIVRSDTGDLQADLKTDANGKYTKTLSSAVGYTVTVSASGYAGVTDTGIVILPGATTIHDFILTTGHVYPSGLQMISSPYDYTNAADYPTLMGLATPLTREQRLYSYQPSELQYVAYPTYPADTLHPGQGYWVKLDSTNYTHFQGTPVVTTQVFRTVLQQGWNQIGNPFLEDTALGSIEVDDTKGNVLSSTLAASAIVKLPWVYHQDTNGYTQLTASDSLATWQGYWIYSASPTVLVITPPGGLPPSPPPTQPKTSVH